MFKFQPISSEKFEDLYEEGMREFFDKAKPETFKFKIDRFKAAMQMFGDDYNQDLSSLTMIEIISEISNLQTTKPRTLIRTAKFPKFKALWNYAKYDHNDDILLVEIIKRIEYRYNLNIKWG